MTRLSSGQERMWLLQQLNPASSAYNARIALRFPDGVDERALCRGLDAMVARHAVLRSVFRVDDEGGPYAAEATGFSVPLTWESTDGDWRTVADPFVEVPFDLSAAPPVRGVVVTLPDGSAVLCLVFHHIVMDGRSFAVFTDELSTVYEAELGGGSVRLPEPTASYADYVAWQRENTDVESRLAYWRDELSGARVLDLPVDFPDRTSSPPPGQRASSSCQRRRPRP
ncbi:hypothetical protein GCM10029964_055450 [Kibdelosporangium lantanae]